MHVTQSPLRHRQAASIKKVPLRATLPSSGTSPVPPHQLLPCFGKDAPIRRVDLSKASDNEFGDLYQAYQRATFWHDHKDVFDETYRNAGKMHIERDLLTNRRGLRMELYKLNIHAKDDFFKPHKDTARGKRVFGSLVIVLPTQHEGGALRTVDLGWELATSDKPSIDYVAFFSDVEHEVMPVINYGGLLPDGGYLGFGLRNQYIYDDSQSHSTLLDKLKGADRVLAEVCEELGLDFELKAIYRGLGPHGSVNLLCSHKLK
ncbi:hypothetical protein F5I97DRAFT_1939134 [Phlebopus sp. FC_14]|nr:hypothetical protein F5I97DRAFT_1939134 [Phlebopus sp. FC_14]